MGSPRSVTMRPLTRNAACCAAAASATSRAPAMAIAMRARRNRIGRMSVRAFYHVVSFVQLVDRGAQVRAFVFVLRPLASVTEGLGRGVDVPLHERRRSHAERGGERGGIPFERPAEQRA